MTVGGQNSWDLNKAGDKESPPQVSTRAAEHGGGCAVEHTRSARRG